MTTYLLTWNPKKTEFKSLARRIQRMKTKGYSDSSWSTGGTRRIVGGDRLFLVRQRVEPMGIVGSGHAISDNYVDEHWEEARAKKGDTANYVMVRWDHLVVAESNPEQVLSIRAPRIQGFPDALLASGISCPEKAAAEIERRWALLNKNLTVPLSDETPETSRYTDGDPRYVSVTVYERNPKARAACIAHFGTKCHVCNFDFHAAYPETRSL